jgi:hypothetical protein
LVYSTPSIALPSKKVGVAIYIHIFWGKAKIYLDNIKRKKNGTKRSIVPGVAILISDKIDFLEQQVLRWQYIMVKCDYPKKTRTKQQQN